MRPFVLILLVLWSLAACPLPVRADSVLHFTSDPGENLAHGQERTVVDSPNGVFSVTGDHRSIYADIIDEHGNGYSLTMNVPYGSLLIAGDYAQATRQGSETNPTLDFSVTGIGSNASTGEFQVLEIGYSAKDKLTAFAANFVIHSENGAPALYGQIRYRSSLPYLTPAGVGQLAANHYGVLAGETEGVAVKVTRQDGMAGRLVVDYDTADGTCVAGRDYTATSGTLTWENGDTVAKTVTIPILDLPGVSQGGAFRMVLSGTGAGAQRQAVVTVVNDSTATTFVRLDSDPDDPIGKGEQRFFSEAGGYAFKMSYFQHGVFLTFTNEDSADAASSEYWFVELAAADYADTVVGSYPDAQLYHAAGAGHPGLDIATETVNPAYVKGHFEVLEIAFDDQGNVTKFAASFEQHCNGIAPALYGEVRYHSTVPLPAARLPRVSVVGVSPAAAGGAGVFTLARSGSTAQALRVPYRIAGGAVGGRDYVALKGVKTIKTGEKSARVNVRPPEGTSLSGQQVGVKMVVEPPDGVFTVIGDGKAKIKVYQAE